MRQIREDLWETEADSPAPGLTTHAYLWVPLAIGLGGRPSSGNVLFYNTAGTGDVAEIERLGGVAHQYLSHQDEVGPMLRTFAQRFGAVLHAPAAELDAVSAVRRPGIAFDTRHVDPQGVEVIPTPGHSPGSTCFMVTGHDGLRYLFTGDTILCGADGRWFAGFVPGVSEAGPLTASLGLLRSLTPDLVVSSAFTGGHGAHLLGERPWAGCVDEALAALRARGMQRARS